MNRVSVIIPILVFTVINLGCSLCREDEPTEIANDIPDAVPVAEELEAPKTVTEITDDPYPYHDENLNLVGPTSGENRTCIYCSGVNQGDPVITGSDLSEELINEIFEENKLVYVYYGPGEIPDATGVIIEFAEPYTSPYVGKIRGDEVRVYGVHSDGTKSLLSDNTLGPGRESVIGETHLLTYIIEVRGPFLDTPATLIELSMLYDIEDYGTGTIQIDLYIEP